MLRNIKILPLLIFSDFSYYSIIFNRIVCADPVKYVHYVLLLLIAVSFAVIVHYAAFCR